MKPSPLRPGMSRSKGGLSESGQTAREINAKNAALRLKNIERLKAARLARDAALPLPVAIIAPVPKRRKKMTIV